MWGLKKIANQSNDVLDIHELARILQQNVLYITKHRLTMGNCCFEIFILMIFFAKINLQLKTNFIFLFKWRRQLPHLLWAGTMHNPTAGNQNSNKQNFSTGNLFPISVWTIANVLWAYGTSSKHKLVLYSGTLIK